MRAVVGLSDGFLNWGTWERGREGRVAAGLTQGRRSAQSGDEAERKHLARVGREPAREVENEVD